MKNWVSIAVSIAFFFLFASNSLFYDNHRLLGGGPPQHGIVLLRADRVKHFVAQRGRRAA